MSDDVCFDRYFQPEWSNFNVHLAPTRSEILVLIDHPLEADLQKLPCTMAPMMMMLFVVCTVALWLSEADALSAISSVKPSMMMKNRPTASALHAVSARQVAAVDGAEWKTLQSVLFSEQKTDASSEVGYMTIVTGTLDNTKDRVVGIQATTNKDGTTIPLDSSTRIYAHSMARIPSQISDSDAISTCVNSLVGIHCALPKLKDVGGGEESFISGKVVVMGGSDYACFVSEGLSALGAQVIQVSTGNPKLKTKSNVQVMEPAVGELELGFADVVGEFDALVDTMHDETNGRRILSMEEDPLGGGVVRDLQKHHKCKVYVSTLSRSQRIVEKAGVLFGPGKARAHVSEINQKIATGGENSVIQPIVPPDDFGTTLQTLLSEGVTFKASSNQKVLVRGWSLSEFWESTSWPRDATGGKGIRYGLPAGDDVDTMIQERMVSEPPVFNKSRFSKSDQNEELASVVAAAEPVDPFVMNIRGVDGLQRDIIAAEKDCLLFLSAPWCRTCAKLSPLYTRMARQHSDSTKVTFAKADATGRMGKALGKALDVNAVPSFVLFREGQVYGTLFVSRLPSKKLDMAIDYLSSGMEWDDALFAEETDVTSS